MGATPKTKYTVVLAYWTRAYATIQLESETPFDARDHSLVWEKAKTMAAAAEWKMVPMEPDKVTVYAVREGWDSEQAQGAEVKEKKK